MSGQRTQREGGDPRARRLGSPCSPETAGGCGLMWALQLFRSLLILCALGLLLAVVFDRQQRDPLDGALDMAE